MQGKPYIPNAIERYSDRVITWVSKSQLSVKVLESFEYCVGTIILVFHISHITFHILLLCSKGRSVDMCSFKNNHRIKGCMCTLHFMYMFKSQLNAGEIPDPGLVSPMACA